MEIRTRRPFARGVSQLMYVGDDEAVDKAVAAPSAKDVGAGLVAALVAAKSKGVVRLAAAGIASWMAYRVYKARAVSLG